jgi:hypothetical protein
MITLPSAYLVARLFTDYVNLPDILAALIASLLIYAGDWFSAEPAWNGPKDYLGRLIYVVFNVAILMALLTGTVVLGESGGS